MEHSKRWYYGWTVGILAAIAVCSLAALAMGRVSGETRRDLGSILSRGRAAGDRWNGEKCSNECASAQDCAGASRRSRPKQRGGGVSGAVRQSPGDPRHPGVATGASFGAVLAILSGWPSLAIQTNALLFGIDIRIAGEPSEKRGRTRLCGYDCAGGHGGGIAVFCSGVPGEIRGGSPGCASRDYLLADGKPFQHDERDSGAGAPFILAEWRFCFCCAGS